MRRRISSRLGEHRGELLDGGDRACGELLLVLAARVRTLAPGAHIRLVATDPAAAIDLPFWCHLTGHSYLGSGLHDDDRPYYDVRIAARARATQPDRPWRLQQPTSNPIPRKQEGHP